MLANHSSRWLSSNLDSSPLSPSFNSCMQVSTFHVSRLSVCEMVESPWKTWCERSWSSWQTCACMLWSPWNTWWLMHWSSWNSWCLMLWSPWKTARPLSPSTSRTMYAVSANWTLFSSTEMSEWKKILDPPWSQLSQRSINKWPVDDFFKGLIKAASTVLRTITLRLQSTIAPWHAWGIDCEGTKWDMVLVKCLRDQYKALWCLRLSISKPENFRGAIHNLKSLLSKRCLLLLSTNSKASKDVMVSVAPVSKTANPSKSGCCTCPINDGMVPGTFWP